MMITPCDDNGGVIRVLYRPLCSLLLDWGRPGFVQSVTRLGSAGLCTVRYLTGAGRVLYSLLLGRDIALFRADVHLPDQKFAEEERKKE